MEKVALAAHLKSAKIGGVQSERTIMWARGKRRGFSPGATAYSVAKIHRMPYLYRSFSAKDPYK